MKFETLRLMAQDYADRHKEPPSLPATIDTMAYAYQRICQGEDPWTALGDFSNAWSGYARYPPRVGQGAIDQARTGD